MSAMTLQTEMLGIKIGSEFPAQILPYFSVFRDREYCFAFLFNHLFSDILRLCSVSAITVTCLQNNLILVGYNQESLIFLHHCFQHV